MTRSLNEAVRLRAREAERFAVSVMTQLRLPGGATVDALICNLATKGFMINCPGEFDLDTVVTLIVPGIGPREGTVVWSFCGDTGGEFLEPIDMDDYWQAVRPPEAKAQAMPVVEHLGRWFERGAERIMAQGRFRLDLGDERFVHADIRDISSLGLKASCPGTLPIGSFVTVDIPGIGATEAEVKWQLGGDFGAMFVDRIDLRDCAWEAVRASFSGR